MKTERNGATDIKDVSWFFNDLYFANIYFVPAFDDASISASIKDIFDVESELSNKSCDGRCTLVEGENGWGIYIWVAKKDKSTRNLQALAHECLHATNMILSRVGVKVDIDNNDEAQAYLLGWIFAKCFDYLYEEKA